MSMTSWAENEVRIACKHENPDWDGGYTAAYAKKLFGKIYIINVEQHTVH